MSIGVHSLVDSLAEVFREEIMLYKQLLNIEGRKTEAIKSTNGELLEDLAKNTFNLMATATEIERVRLNIIEDIYKKEKLNKAGDVPILSEFLNQLDRDSNFKLKGLAKELKSTVHTLKDKLNKNSIMLKARKEYFQFSIDALKKAAGTNQAASYQSGDRIRQRPAEPVMLDTKA